MWCRGVLGTYDMGICLSRIPTVVVGCSSRTHVAPRSAALISALTTSTGRAGGQGEDEKEGGGGGRKKGVMRGDEE